MPGRGQYWKKGGLLDGTVNVEDLAQAVQDQLGTIGSALLAELNADQTTVGASTDIVWDLETINIGSDISLNTGTGQITLEPGTYELRADLHANTFSDATGGELVVVWVDNSNTPLNQSEALLEPTTSTSASNSQPTPSTLVTFGSQTIVKLRCVNAIGTATITAGASRAIVKKLA